MEIRKADIWLPAAIVLMALFLRFWGTADMDSYAGDQGVLVPAAAKFLDTGQFAPDSWEHPPMKYFLIRGSMAVFGNNPYGWRMKNVLFGTFAVLVLYLLGREIFGDDKRTPLLAALMLAADPLHLFFSRSVYGEVSSIIFLLLAALVTARYLHGKTGSPLAAGIFLGLALAQKWYYFFPGAFLFLFVAWVRMRRNGFRLYEQLNLIAVYGVLPLTLYLLPFYPWFGRGYSIREFVRMQLDAYRLLQIQDVDYFLVPFFRNSPSDAWQWFITPVIYGAQLTPDGAWSRFLTFMNNPPVWLLVWPAVLYLSYRAWREKSPEKVLSAGLFLTSYLQFILWERATFLYSAIVVIPFAFLAVSYMLTSLLERMHCGSRSFGLLFSGLTVWGLYLYPLVAFRLVPVILYLPIISLGTIIR